MEKKTTITVNEYKVPPIYKVQSLTEQFVKNKNVLYSWTPDINPTEQQRDFGPMCQLVFSTIIIKTVGKNDVHILTTVPEMCSGGLWQPNV